MTILYLLAYCAICLLLIAAGCSIDHPACGPEKGKQE